MEPDEIEIDKKTGDYVPTTPAEGHELHTQTKTSEPPVEVGMARAEEEQGIGGETKAATAPTKKFADLLKSSMDANEIGKKFESVNDGEIFQSVKDGVVLGSIYFGEKGRIRLLHDHGPCIEMNKHYKSKYAINTSMPYQAFRNKYLKAEDDSGSVSDSIKQWLLEYEEGGVNIRNLETKKAIMYIISQARENGVNLENIALALGGTEINVKTGVGFGELNTSLLEIGSDLDSDSDKKKQYSHMSRGTAEKSFLEGRLDNNHDEYKKYLNVVYTAVANQDKTDIELGTEDDKLNKAYNEINKQLAKNQREIKSCKGTFENQMKSLKKAKAQLLNAKLYVTLKAYDYDIPMDKKQTGIIEKNWGSYWKTSEGEKKEGESTEEESKKREPKLSRGGI